MILILFILLLLSLTLFLYKEREGLDNCPPIEGTTSSGLTNTANLASIKKKIDNVNVLKQQIMTKIKIFYNHIAIGTIFPKQNGNCISVYA